MTLALENCRRYGKGFLTFAELSSSMLERGSFISSDVLFMGVIKGGNGAATATGVGAWATTGIYGGTATGFGAENKIELTFN